MTYQYINFDSATKLNYIRKNNEAKATNHCPFCHLQAIKDDGNYIEDLGNGMHYIFNKYQTLLECDSRLIIEHDYCDVTLHNMTVDELYNLFKVTLEKREEMLQEYQSVLLFKQYGKYSCSSVEHGHIQLIGTNKEESFPNDTAIFKSAVGTPIYEDIEDSFEINISDYPMGEYLEYNILMDKLNKTALYKMQIILNHILTTQVPYPRDSYSVSAHVLPNGKLLFKIMDRKLTSTFKLHFGLTLVSTNSIDNNLITKLNK